jgi:hypothetical protein
MARIRTIKPEFWKHEDLSELPPETHMLGAALLNYSDDEGYFNANIKLIKAECCPLREDSTNIRRGLEQLSKVGYLRLGNCPDGKSYGHVLNFLEHQRVDRPTPSKIKALDILWDASTNPRRILDEGSSLEGKGKERNIDGENAIVYLKDLVALGIDKEKAKQFLAIRKTKRLPLTPTALEGMIAEGQKVGYTLQQVIEKCLVETWGSFKASWLDKAELTGVPDWAKE